MLESEDHGNEIVAIYESYEEGMIKALAKFYDDQKINPTYGELDKLYNDLDTIQKFLTTCVTSNITAPFINTGKPLDSLTADLYTETVKLMSKNPDSQQGNAILVNNAVGKLKTKLYTLLGQSAVYM